jgi:hypothetical protein
VYGTGTRTTAANGYQDDEWEWGLETEIQNGDDRVGISNVFFRVMFFFLCQRAFKDVVSHYIKLYCLSLYHFRVERFSTMLLLVQ